MFAVEDGVGGAENQPRAGVGTQAGQVARQINIHGLGKLRVSLAKVDIRQRRGVDDRKRPHFAEHLGHLTRRQQVADVPAPIRPLAGLPRGRSGPGRLGIARDRVHLPVNAGLCQDTAGHEPVRAGNDQLSFGVHFHPACSLPAGWASQPTVRDCNGPAPPGSSVA